MLYSTIIMIMHVFIEAFFTHKSRNLIIENIDENIGFI